MLNEFQAIQLINALPNTIKELTGIVSVKCTYDYSSYDSWDGSNQIEKRHMTNFAICRGDKYYQISDMSAATLIAKCVTVHMYKKLIRSVADNSGTYTEKLDMSVPLETYNSWNKYD